MIKEESIRFAGLMEDYLNIPSFVCEMIQQQLEENKYKEVIEYVIQRRNEIESKPEFISDRNAITMLVNQNEQKDKEIERLNNIIEELKKDLIKEIDSLQDIEVESKEDIRCRTLCNVLDKLSDLIGELKEGKE